MPDSHPSTSRRKARRSARDACFYTNQCLTRSVTYRAYGIDRTVTPAQYNVFEERQI
jgi:hypothetical protein